MCNQESPILSILMIQAPNVYLWLGLHYNGHMSNHREKKFELTTEKPVIVFQLLVSKATYGQEENT